LQHLIFEGTLDRFPGLKILGAHGGGYLGSYAPRSDHACFVSPSNCNPDIVLKKKPTEYLDQIFFDALVFTPEALRHLVAQWARARWCSAPIIRFHGKNIRSTMCWQRRR